MDVLDLTTRIAVVLFMVGSLGGVGLGLAPRDVLAPLRHRAFVVRSLVVSWLLCPVVAVLLLRVVPLAPPYATGLLLLALAPCAPFAPAMVQTARGDSAYLAAFIVLSAVTTIVVMPLAVPLLTGLPADPVAIARPLLLFVLLPLLLGLALKGFHPRVAEQARRPMATMTNVAGAVLLLLIGAVHGRAVVEAVGSYAIATQTVFVGVITLGAYLSGRGLADDQKSVLTIGVCTRNLGAALAPLAAIEPDSRALVMIAIAAPVTLVMSTLTARWLAVRLAPPA